jgi:hypothetical protein
LRGTHFVAQSIPVVVQSVHACCQTLVHLCERGHLEPGSLSEHGQAVPRRGELQRGHVWPELKHGATIARQGVRGCVGGGRRADSRSDGVFSHWFPSPHHIQSSFSSDIHWLGELAWHFYARQGNAAIAIHHTRCSENESNHEAKHVGGLGGNHRKMGVLWFCSVLEILDFASQVKSQQAHVLVGRQRSCTVLTWCVGWLGGGWVDPLWLSEPTVPTAWPAVCDAGRAQG